MEGRSGGEVREEVRGEGRRGEKRMGVRWREERRG